MTRFIIVCIINGMLFGTMDAVINANPFARKLFTVYEPIAKTAINAPAGIVIDLLYGFVIGFLFLLLYNALPGDSGIIKGIVFVLIIWFFRILMGVLSSWMMFTVPVLTLSYVAVTGLLEMLVLGVIYGIFLKPFK